MIQRHLTMKNAKRAWYVFAIAVPTLAVGMVLGLFLMFVPYINYWLGWAIGAGRSFSLCWRKFDLFLESGIPSIGLVNS